MALSHFLHSAYTIVLGHQNDNPKVQNEKILTGHHPKGANSHEEEASKRLEFSKHNQKPSAFQMPLHYPRYKRGDYEKMEEWKLDILLKQYGLEFDGNLDEKRAYAMGAFLWPDQL